MVGAIQHTETRGHNGIGAKGLTGIEEYMYKGAWEASLWEFSYLKFSHPGLPVI